MKIIDQKLSSWYLFKEKEKLLFDVNCSHSFIGYNFMMYLNSEESELYNQHGREYLNKLAQDINFSSPISKSSSSEYKDRDVTIEYSERSLSAIEHWRAENSINASTHP